MDIRREKTAGESMTESISTSIKIARHIAYLCRESGYEYNATKIQKLLYVCYGVVLACIKQRLTEELPVIWPYGPVFPNALKDFKKNSLNKDKYEKKDSNLSCQVKDILSESVKFFGNFKTGQLSAWSHKEGSPWNIVVSEKNSKWNQPLPDDVLLSYFKDEVVERWQTGAPE